MTIKEILQESQKAKLFLALTDTEVKNNALQSMAQALVENTASILEANTIDMEAARQHISEVMLDRLMLNEERLQSMGRGILDVVKLEDPVGKVLKTIERPNGLKIDKVSVPMGVIAIIYESRPNVTSDAAALALKAGSACILRCGHEAWNTCNAIVAALRKGIVRAGLPEECISLVMDTSHASATELMQARGLVDLLIPRGGKRLIQACVENATVPCIETGTGICHVFVDESADKGMALNVIDNAKTSRPSVCNAIETVLVHKNIAGTFLPLLYQRLVTEKQKKGLPQVELHVDETAGKIISGIPLQEADYDTEYMDYKMSVGVVEDVQEAIHHIALHSTHHSETILTNSQKNADLFTRCVDSAAVYVNASTRFTDGGEFGLGCEMGISTQKLHARGPMGLEELCTYKYIIHGNGQIRESVTVSCYIKEK